MKELIIFCALLCGILAGSLVGEESARGQDREGSGIYTFLGADVRKTWKGASWPVVSAVKRGVMLDTEKGMKRSKFGEEGVVLARNLKTTTAFAKVQEVKVSFSNRAHQSRVSDAAFDLEADVQYAEDVRDGLVSDWEQELQEVRGKPGNLSDADMEAVVEDHTGFVDNLLEGIYDSESRAADTIHLAFTIFSDEELEAAYAAVVARYNRPVEGKAVPTTVVSLESLGNLQKGVPNEVKLDVTTLESRLNNLKIELYLFNGDGTPIATNVSSAVRELSVEEAATLKASG